MNRTSISFVALGVMLVWNMVFSPGKKPAPPAGTTTTANGITARKISNDEVVERCIFALVNEGARILEEGIAARASDIDIVYLNGYGFPLHRGGPMLYADTVGLPNVLRTLRRFAAEDQ